MGGFPLVDREFYEKSLMISALLLRAATGKLSRFPASPGGGPFGDLDLKTAEQQRRLLLFLAKTDNASRDFPLPVGNALLSLQLKRFASLRELGEHLTATHQPQFWYRGQNQQHVALYEGSIAALADRLPSVRVAFDALIPSFFRAATQTIPAQWKGAATHDLPPLDYFPRIARAIINSSHDGVREMLVRFLRDVWRPAMLAAVRREGGFHIRDPEAEARARPWTNLPQSQLELISLAQHYEYGSVMVDVTRSVDVAVWFATHRFSDGTLIGAKSEDLGVIYRFDEEAIKDVLRTRFLHESGGPPLVPHLGLFGLADISTMSGEIAKRPAAQRGGSLLGFENSVLHLLLLGASHFQAFTFPHKSADGSETQFSREDLCPTDDPALVAFSSQNTHTAASPISAAELDQFLLDCKTDEDERKQIVRLRKEGAL